MKQFQYTIADPNGLHARPAGLLVQAAQGFTSEIQMACGEKQANLKRLFAVMGMNVKHGEEVKITVEGPDEAAAAQTLEDFFRAHF